MDPQFEERTEGGYEYVIYTFKGRHPDFPIMGECLIPRWDADNHDVWVPTQWNEKGATAVLRNGNNANLVPIILVHSATIEAGLATFRRRRSSYKVPILVNASAEAIKAMEKDQDQAVISAIRAAIASERKLSRDPNNVAINTIVFEHGWEAAKSVDEEGNTRRSFNAAMRAAVLKDREVEGR